MARKKLSAYQRIMRAAQEGVGVRLSAKEVGAMSCDDAIAEVALGDDEADEAREDKTDGR